MKTLSFWLIAILCVASGSAQAQYRLPSEYFEKLSMASFSLTSIGVINMMPNAQSNETNQDSEPSIGVNPANTLNMVGSAFTLNPTGSLTTAPIYVSSDGGNTWSLNNIVPSGNGQTGDISVKFGTKGSELYAGILLGGSGLHMNILRSDNPFGSTTMPVLVDRFGSGVDQPFVNTLTSRGFLVVQASEFIPALAKALPSSIFFIPQRDRVFVGNNDFNAGTQTATVDHSPDARTAAAPANFTNDVVEDRTTNGQDRPSVRCAAHADGTVYTLFARTTASSGSNRTCDVTVVRDDAFATGGSPFSALTSGGSNGVLVVTGVNMPFINAAGALGQNRLGSHMSIAVDPNNSDIVYIAWTDRTGSSGTNLHIRRSSNRGVGWSADLLTITNGLNPAIAINSSSLVGFLYQQLTGSSRWETHVRRSANNGSSWSDVILSDTPDNTPAPTFQPYLGDYCDMMAVGRNFYGVFSASNVPDNANFPHGVTYQRNANFTTHQLRNVANTSNVAASIDPFFFRITTSGIVGTLCDICPACCELQPKLDKNLIVLECKTGDFCIIRDPIPKNCLVKYDCPGCGTTALCPPYYHIFLDDIDPEMWEIGIRTSKDEPVQYEFHKTRTGCVLSFRPDKKLYREREIGDYELIFGASEKVKPNTQYRVRTHLEVSDYRFAEHQKYYTAGK